MGVDHRQDAELLAQGELVVDEIHRLDIVWIDRFSAILTQLRLHPPLRVLVAELQAQLIVNPAGPLHVDHPSFTPQKNVDAPVAVAHTGLGNLLDQSLDGSLVRPPGFVVVCGGVKADGPTGLPDRHTPVDAHPGDDLAQTARLQSFRRMTSCNISRSSVRSATIFFNRPFSSSSAFNRRISSGSNPPYRFFQLK